MIPSCNIHMRRNNARSRKGDRHIDRSSGQRAARVEMVFVQIVNFVVPALHKAARNSSKLLPLAHSPFLH